MKNYHNKKSGIILTEALVAIAMITVGTLIVSSVINSAVSTTKLSKGYLIAQNLVTEGVEVVKNLKSTNLLTASEDRTCWLRIDPSQACNIGGIKADTAKDYILENPNDKWYLVESQTGDPLDLKNTLTDDYFYQIYTGGQLAYMSEGKGDALTPYYRSVKFKTIDPGNDFATVEVLVQWKDGSKVREVARTLTIYNY